MSGMTDENRRSQVARKTTLVSVVVNLFYPALRCWRACFADRKDSLPMVSILFPI